MESHFILHLLHVFIIGGLFLYIGIKKTNICKSLYNPLIILGIFIILYHSYKIYKKIKQNINPWINYIHVLIIAPLLIYIGINKEKTNRLYFEIILMLAFATIGYHGYYLL
jgi:hypothetical protein